MPYVYIILPNKSENDSITILPENHEQLILEGTPFWQADIFPKHGTIFYRFNVGCCSSQTLHKKLETALKEAGHTPAHWPNLFNENAFSGINKKNATELYNNFIKIKNNLRNLKLSFPRIFGPKFDDFISNIGGDFRRINIDIKSESNVYVVVEKHKFHHITYKLDVHIDNVANKKPETIKDSVVTCQNYDDLLIFLKSSIDKMKSDQGIQELEELRNKILIHADLKNHLEKTKAIDEISNPLKNVILSPLKILLNQIGMMPTTGEDRELLDLKNAIIDFGKNINEDHLPVNSDTLTQTTTFQQKLQQWRNKQAPYQPKIAWGKIVT